MAATDTIVVEGFIVDQDFTNQSKSINGVLAAVTGTVGSLSPKGLSYFQQPAVFADTRAASTRTVNWAPTSVAKMVVDEEAFPNFYSTTNALSPSDAVAFFKIIDALLFNYNPNTTHATIETFLTTDADTSTIYVPGSFTFSTTIVAGTVYLPSNQTQTVNVPASVNFSINLTSGSTTQEFSLTLYTSIDAFLVGYSVSSIVDVIPPLPYATLYTTSLVSSTDSIFATATTSASLAYSTTQPVFGTQSVSGITEYLAILTDGNNNNASVPFNILYKGRTPTLLSIRDAIQAALLASGVGTAAGWQARIPGVFVSGRFYIIPLWDQTYPKPDQLIFPSVLALTTYSTVTNTILASLGNGDVSQYTDILSVFYNRMQATAVPDLTGTVAIQHLNAIIPDYQDYSSTDPNFEYMTQATQNFASALNTILAVDSGAQTSTVYTPITEDLLTFYSFTVSSYEICVISKFCYETIIGSTQ